MSHAHRPRISIPLDEASLNALALHYLARFSTTRARLAAYLARKVRERGWRVDDAADKTRPDPEVGAAIAAVVARCADAGYVDDTAYAQIKVASLARRGLGPRRVVLALRVAGVDRDLAQSFTPDDDAAFAAAELYARRKRIGRFGNGAIDPVIKHRQFAAMLRAGHSIDLAKKFVDGSGADDTVDDAAGF